MIFKFFKFFEYLSVCVLILGITLFYVLKINIWFKWGIVALSTIIAVIIFLFISNTGLNLHGYIRDSWRELGKVVWPTRQETVQTTLVVAAMVVVVALVLWGVDSLFLWMISELAGQRG